MENQNKGYFVPLYIMQNGELSLLEKNLFCMISALSSKEGYCYAKNAYFAEIFGRSERQIRNAMEKLVTLGFVCIDAENRNERKIYIVSAIDEAEENKTEEKEECKSVGGSKMTPPKKKLRKIISKIAEINFRNI